MEERIITPKAKCRYPYIFQPYTKFNKDGTYKVDLIFDPQDAEHKKFLETMKAIFAESKGTRQPWKAELDKDGNKTGNFTVQFKSNFPFRVFDAMNQTVQSDKNFIGSGSTVRVAFKPKVYTENGGGVSLYINGLQVIDLVKYEGATAQDLGFSEEATGYNAFQVAQEFQEEHSDPDTTNQPSDDDLPF